jgi:hypothetical protein
MAAPTIPGPQTQAVNVVGATQSFTVAWYNFFASLVGFVAGPGDRIGFADGSSAPAGDVGEYLHTFVLSGAAINLPNNTDTQIASLALTAGDWDLWGEIFVQPTAATITNTFGAINTAVNTAPTVPADGVDFTDNRGISTTGLVAMNGLRTRVSIASPTTYLLVASVLFTGTSAAGYGALRARRMR